MHFIVCILKFSRSVRGYFVTLIKNGMDPISRKLAYTKDCLKFDSSHVINPKATHSRGCIV